MPKPAWPWTWRSWPALWVHFDTALEPCWMASRRAWGRIVGQPEDPHHA